MILHFAYGANMHRQVMAKYAPEAQYVGIAKLENYRFIITADGYASIEPSRAATVHGVVWGLTPRDRISLDIWEGVARRLYTAERLRVRCACRSCPALIYVARSRQARLAKPGYVELVIAAALEQRLPQTYIASLRHWLPRHPRRLAWPKSEEFG
jgi:hypothetical protein